MLEFIRENIGLWKGKKAHKKNMFSQQDSEAQFINQDDEDEEEEEGDYGEEGQY